MKKVFTKIAQVFSNVWSSLCAYYQFIILIIVVLAILIIAIVYGNEIINVLPELLNE